MVKIQVGLVLTYSDVCLDVCEQAESVHSSGQVNHPTLFSSTLPCSQAWGEGWRGVS